MSLEITLIRSRRKSIAIEVKPDLTVIVRAPLRMPKREIERFVKEKEDWIYQAIDKIRLKKARCEADPVEPLTDADIKKLASQAKEYLPKRVAYYAARMGLSYGRITIRNQKTRWGSCSSKGNLNFNCLLMLTPPEVIDYVIVHELCHLIEMNHSPAFWHEVEKVLPDYRDRVKWLKTQGASIIRRME